MASTQTLVFIAISGLLLGFLLYRWLLPKPFPGIPYNLESSKHLMGDALNILKHKQETGEVATFFLQRSVELDSPIIQLFARPFSTPAVVVVDRATTQDVLVRRTPREFDRSNFFGDVFAAILPDTHIIKPTNAQWRFNRRLIADTMSPSFLQDVAGPHVHYYVSNMIEFWKKKQALAQNHPIDAKHDVEGAMLDAIYAASFGLSVGAIDAQKVALSHMDKLDSLSTNTDVAAEFPRAPDPVAYSALRTLIDSSEIPMASPFGRNHHRFALNVYPSLRKARKHSDAFIYGKLDDAWQRFTRDEDNATDNDAHVKCAVDLVVAREVAAARKEGRTPRPHSAILHDEIFGFIMAGHDTTGTNVLWGIKLLTKYPHVQQKLREYLRNIFADDADAGTSPSALAIGRTSTPFLDAVVEEIVRCGQSTPGLIRQTVQDVELLGHVIPKGTDVFFLTAGPGYFGPSLPANKPVGEREKPAIPPSKWSVDTLADFQPERFLDKDENGEWRFDSRTEFNHSFGAGVRACFGRKLAHLSLRIMFTLLVWNFELGAPPDDLATWKAIDGIAHRPQQAFVRLATPPA